MPVHTVSLDDDTAKTLRGIASDKTIHLLTLESAILEQFAMQWESATPHERQRIMDNLGLVPRGD